MAIKRIKGPQVRDLIALRTYPSQGYKRNEGNQNSLLSCLQLDLG